MTKMSSCLNGGAQYVNAAYVNGVDDLLPLVVLAYCCGIHSLSEVSVIAC